MLRSFVITSLIITVVVISFSTTSAQKPKQLIDVVYLKNGSIIRGTIIEYFENKTVKIETSCKNIWVFKYDEILMLEKEETVDTQNSTGYTLCPFMGFLSGKHESVSVSTVSFGITNAYRFPIGITAGIGVAFEALEVITLPLYLDLRYDIPKMDFSPLFFFHCGYTCAFGSRPIDTWSDIDEEFSGGFRWAVGTGVRKYLTNSVAIILNFGFSYQKINSIRDDYSWMSNSRIETEYEYKRVMFSFGFVFN